MLRLPASYTACIMLLWCGAMPASLSLRHIGLTQPRRRNRGTFPAAEAQGGCDAVIYINTAAPSAASAVVVVAIEAMPAV